MLKCATRQLRSSLFWIVAQPKVKRPQLSITEQSELHTVRGKHHGNYKPRKVTPRLWQWILKCFVSLNKHCWWIEFTMNFDCLWILLSWLPVQPIGFKMKVVEIWSRDLVADYRNKTVVVKFSCFKLLLAWVLHSAVEWNFDSDWCLCPVTITFTSSLILPTIINISALWVSTHMGFNHPPIDIWYVFWSVVWMTNNIEKVCEAGLWFFESVIPVPLSQ